MDDRKVLSGRRWHGNVRDSFGGRRQRGEKREWKMPHGVAKFGTIRSIPGMDGVESFELRNPSVFQYSHQIQTRIGNGPGTIGEANQRQHRTRRPDFGVSRARSFECREQRITSPIAPGR